MRSWTVDAEVAMNRTEFDEGPIKYILVGYGTVTDLYKVGTGISMVMGDGANLIEVNCIYPVRVAGECGWVIWFDIYDLDNFLVETINSKFVVKVGHGIAVAEDAHGRDVSGLPQLSGVQVHTEHS
jgi:hypothetical protein